MFEIIKIFLGLIIGFPLVIWWLASGSGWQELAEKYKTEQSLPNFF